MSSLVRSLGRRESLALVVGTVVGTGVFLKTSTMVQSVGSPFWVLMAWVVAGALSLVGALSYAELGCAYPEAGGEYVFLRKGFGPLISYLYGWTRFWVGSPGTIAAYAVGASTFLDGLMPLTGWQMSFCAVFFIWFFSFLNCWTVALGGRVQNVITALKVLLVAGLSLALFSSGQPENFTSAPDGFWGTWPGFSNFGAAILAALWAFDGWNNMPMAAGEIKNPSRAIPLALVLGLPCVLGLYVLINAAYFYALPFSEILTASSTSYPDAPSVANKAVTLLFGVGAGGLLALGFVISALGAMNGSILTSARVPYAMAHDGLFFSRLKQLHLTRRVPIEAILAQAAWSSILALSGTFDQLTDCVVFSSWIFYLLAVASLFTLRRQTTPSKDTFRIPFFPWLPIVFIACSLLLLGNTLYTSPKESLVGLFIIALGLPFFFWFRRRY